MTLPATSPEPAAEAGYSCADCGGTAGHADDCAIGFFEAALDDDPDLDAELVADLNDGEDWGWEP